MSRVVNKNFSEEQFWRAFQYVSGEFGNEAEIAFEDELVSETGLSEALIEATRLTMLVKDGSALPKPSIVINAESVAGETQRSSRTGAAMVMAAVVACCVLMVALVSNQGRKVDEVGVVTVEPPETELIVDAWVDIAPESADDASGSEETVGELDVPDWMLAAVELSALDNESLSVPDQG